MQWFWSLLSSRTKFKPGDDRQAYAIDRPEPLLHFALSSGSHSDPAVDIHSPFLFLFSFCISFSFWVQFGNGTGFAVGLRGKTSIVGYLIYNNGDHFFFKLYSSLRIPFVKFAFASRCCFLLFWRDLLYPGKLILHSYRWRALGQSLFFAACFSVFWFYQCSPFKEKIFLDFGPG